MAKIFFRNVKTKKDDLLDIMHDQVRVLEIRSTALSQQRGNLKDFLVDITALVSHNNGLTILQAEKLRKDIMTVIKDNGGL